MTVSIAIVLSLVSYCLSRVLFDSRSSNDE